MRRRSRVRLKGNNGYVRPPLFCPQAVQTDICAAVPEHAISRRVLNDRIQDLRLVIAVSNNDTIDVAFGIEHQSHAVRCFKLY